MISDLISRKEKNADPVGLVALASQVHRVNKNKAYELVKTALSRATAKDVEGILDLCGKHSFPIECNQSFYDLEESVQEKILAYGRTKPSLELLLPLDFWNKRIETVFEAAELKAAIASLEQTVYKNTQVGYEIKDQRFNEQVKVTTLHLKQSVPPFDLMIAFNNAMFNASIVYNKGTPTVQLPQQYSTEKEYGALNVLDELAHWYTKAREA